MIVVMYLLASRHFVQTALLLAAVGRRRIKYNQMRGWVSFCRPESEANPLAHFIQRAFSVTTTRQRVSL